MGITKVSLDRINKFIEPNDCILILGCQNLYNQENYGEVAFDYFLSKGYTVRCIDICGCQGSEVADLREDLNLDPDYNLVLQHGTVEHCDCESLYQAFKNIHESCRRGGIMIHENPKTGNWPLHGYHYFTTKFYEQLAKDCGYEILELTEEPAMGNTVDGWNVSCALRKLENNKFISKSKFDKYDIRKA